MISAESSFQTPVVLIIYRRAEQTRQAINALRLVRPSNLYVVADGPNQNVADDLGAVNAARDVLSSIDWDCQIVKIYSETNMGLRARVLSGLDLVFEQVEEAIVLEDDCMPSPSFFSFAAELLARYQGNSNVGLISGNNFSPNSKLVSSYYFSSHPNIWGWATWRRTWTEFRSSVVDSVTRKAVLDELPRTYPGMFARRSFAKLVKSAGELDSWAIDFACFFHAGRKLAVVPQQNLVQNIGFGGISTHTKFESYVESVPASELQMPLTHQSLVKVDKVQMLRESRSRLSRLITFPFLHPLNFAGRAFRYVSLVRRSRRSPLRLN